MMSLPLLALVLSYVAIAVFVIAVVARFLMWQRMPMHLRWELYPVAHEAPSRAKYGGSYYEMPKWWTQKRETSLAGELSVMVPEMLFLDALREHHPKLWLRSFPFHFGLYLVAGCTALMMLGGVLGAIAPGLAAGGLGTLLHYLVLASGASGIVLGLLGSIGLLSRRLNTPALRNFSTPADFMNLILFIAAFGLSLVTFVAVDRDFALVSTLVGSLVTFHLVDLPLATTQAVLPAATMMLWAAMLAYIPLTHMSHFVGKYFAYHAIRWNDTPNLQGGPEEAIIGAALNRPLSWAAAHIGGDGKKTWAEAATEDTAKVVTP
ncbi:MAG: respiratory nitrate reductase subunit gamma [Pseudomonadota bacterium]